MKRVIIFIMITLLLTACAGSPADAPAEPVVEQAVEVANAVAEITHTPMPPAEAAEETGIAVLSTEYDDAANLRNQLAYGTILLEGTAQAVTVEQAKYLLPLWQAIMALSNTSESVPEELAAVQEQITAGLSPEQITAIVSMQITNTGLNEYYSSIGIVMSTPEPGVTREPGSGKNISDEDREATRTAREASGLEGTGSGQASKTALFEVVVSLLTERASE